MWRELHQIKVQINVHIPITETLGYIFLVYILYHIKLGGPQSVRAKLKLSTPEI